MHMLTKSIRVRYSLVCIMGLFFAMSALVPAYAQSDKEDKPKPTISRATGEVLNKAIGFLNMDDYANALKTINGLDMAKLSPYEHSRVEQILFGIALAQDKYDVGRKHLEAAIAAGGLSQPEVAKAKFTIAKLYILQENYKDGAAALEDWFKIAPEPNSAAYYLLAAAYYQMGEMDKALAPAKKAVELGGDTPNPAWLQMLYALYVDKEDYAKAIPVAERLVELEPKKKSHWQALSSMYQQVGNLDKALATLQIAYNAGLYTQDSEYRRLASLAIYNGIPARCARILESALDANQVEHTAKVYKRLSQCYVNAREFDKSLDPLATAAELSDNGDLYVRLAEVQVQREDWDAVLDAAHKALAKGDLKDEEFAQLMIGMALYSQSKPQEARKWFVRAESSKKHGKTARQYIKRIKYEAQHQQNG